MIYIIHALIAGMPLSRHPYTPLLSTMPPLSRLPAGARHDAAHERVEQRRGECRIAVARTPYHPFGDQLIAGRREGFNLALQQARDLAGAVRPGAKLRHRSEVTLLQRRQAVKPHPEETFIKGRDRGAGCDFGVRFSDG